MKLVLRNTSGETVSLLVGPEETFQDLQKRVQSEVGLALDLHDLAVKGKTIDENQGVIDYFTSPDVTELSKPAEAPPDIQQDVKCSVPSCENTKFSCPEKAFFTLPLEEMRCHQWALYCHRLSDESGKHRITLTAQSVICADHFRKDQFVKNTTTLLKRTAVPCINPEIPIGSSDPVAVRRKPAIRSGLATLKTDLPITLPLPTLDALNLLQQTSGDDVENTAFCRLCSQLCSNFIFIFDEVGIKLNIAEKINSCLPVTVRDTDLLPKQICKSCYDKLLLCHDMAETSLKAESKLQDMITNKHFSSQRLHASDLLSSTFGPSDGEDSQDSNLLDIGNTNKTKSLFCCPLCSCGKMITKSGIYRIKHDSCQSEIRKEDNKEYKEGNHSQCFPGEIDLAVKDNENVLENENEKKNTKKEAIKPTQQHMWGTQDYSLKISDLDMDTLYNDPDSIVGMELDSIPEDEPWENIDTKKDIKVVIKGEKESLICRLCGIEFSELTALLDHSEDHSDTQCFPCTLCEQWFSSKSVLDTHFVDNHFYHKETSNFLHQCDSCGVGFKSVVKLESHVCGSSSGSNRCPHCNKSFRSEARLEFHQRFHEGAKPGYCEICQKTFPDELKLYKHTMYLHSQNKGHCCEECGKVFRSNSSLRYHQRSHQGQDIMKPYPCEYCGKCFIRKSMLRNHFMNTHKDKTQEGTCFTCKLCFEAFPSTDHAVNHMDVMHIPECSGEATYSFEMHTVKRLYLCEYCERSFTDPANLNSHRERHAPEYPYQCKLCNEGYSAASLLGEHKKLHFTGGVSDYITEFTVPTVYMCEYCERCFMNSVKLSEHLTVHFGEEPYHCRFCDKKFKTNLEAADHRLTHDQSLSPIDDSYRPYECHYCPKSFSIEDALVKHIRMHTGEKPFICDQCGKGFSQSSGLYTHQKVHSDERPYNCPFCPRTFKIKGDRDVHVRKHSGDRPYKCDFCGKAFMTQHVYSQHRKIHTGERPYRCDVCGIAFRRSHVLTVHKRIHTGEKPNICDICGKRYRQKGDMLKHRRLQHNIVKVRIQKIEF
ncbi:zinc finger protein 227-like [Macrosteles quadrilineatus]|uniref:zinc finger protein 227-like n=1 Tax=Macrosteles quadrilineatus TaxID=74068 RepID=UPI0023E225C4|nr:zinc finger protein 227-like [Macrosteles quadrilineatus]XP_054261905.1 zinc finger protein 227-like [Macrosteles quadrilineatus]